MRLFSRFSDIIAAYALVYERILDISMHLSRSKFRRLTAADAEKHIDADYFIIIYAYLRKAPSYLFQNIFIFLAEYFINNTYFLNINNAEGTSASRSRLSRLTSQR
jgi:hypothetical protein